MTSGTSKARKIMFAEANHSTSDEALVPIDIVVDRAVKDLEDIRNKITELFRNRPVNLEVAADHIESARAIHGRTINRIQRHHQQIEEGLIIRQVRSSEKIRDRYTQFLSFDLHLKMYNILTGHWSRKTLLLQNKNLRMLKLEEAINGVTSHQKLLLADIGI